MPITMNLAILAMVVISTTAQVSDNAIANDTLSKLEEAVPKPTAESETVKTEKETEEFKLVDAIIGAISIAGKAINTHDEDTFVKIVEITGNDNKTEDKSPTNRIVGGVSRASDDNDRNSDAEDKNVTTINFVGKTSKFVDSLGDHAIEVDVVFAGNAVVENGADIVDADFTDIVSSLCGDVQTFGKVTYEELQNTSKTELDKLHLTLCTNNQIREYTLAEAVTAVPSTSVYDGSKPLVIFMHGFTDNPMKRNFQSINDAFHKKGNFNILALDASPLIRALYMRSSTYVHLIGERLGQTLAALVKAGVKRQDIHLIGHSLGAHIAGFAGKTFHTLTGTKVSRITGLDPAGPCFKNVNDSLRLQSDDAEFVDAIHTNGGVYGLKDPVGQVDYYVNGGCKQPGCYLETCSHSRVVELFAESVNNPDAFPARLCSDWKEFENGKCKGAFSMMGYGCKPATRGLHFLRTRKQSPYGFGSKRVSTTDN